MIVASKPAPSTFERSISDLFSVKRVTLRARTILIHSSRYCAGYPETRGLVYLPGRIKSGFAQQQTFTRELEPKYMEPEAAFFSFQNLPETSVSGSAPIFGQQICRWQVRLPEEEEVAAGREQGQGQGWHHAVPCPNQTGLIGPEDARRG